MPGICTVPVFYQLYQPQSLHGEGLTEGPALSSEGPCDIQGKDDGNAEEHKAVGMNLADGC